MRRLVVVAIAMAVIATLFGTTRALPASASQPSGDTATRLAAEDDDTPADAEETAAPENGEEETAAPDDATPSADPSNDASSDAPSPKVAAKSSYKLHAGITLNSPLGTKAKKYAILHKIHQAIRHTPKGQKIYVMSWNIMWMNSVNLLLKAQKRGVILRILMDKSNYSKTVPNKPWVKLRRGIAAYNKKVAKSKRSHAKVCNHACRRGAAGAAHSKYFIFPQVGATKNVVIQGGNNLTLASAINQWNEIYTFTENRALFNWMVARYKEMWNDRTPSKPWIRYVDDRGNFDMYFSPRIRSYRAGDDPLYSALQKTKCTGATGGAGNSNGRTIIRAAPDVIRGNKGNWGWKVAVRIRQLWDAGCDVKIGYTVMGKNIYQMLRAKKGRGPVPLRHLVQDWNGDKEFDRYFHLKVWTINGAATGDSSFYFAMNGSTNVSNYAVGSDENVGVFKDVPHITKKYQKHVEYWFNNPPPSRPVVPSLLKGPVDPYRNVDLD